MYSYTRTPLVAKSASSAKTEYKTWNKRRAKMTLLLEEIAAD